MSCRRDFIAIGWLLFMGAVLSFSPVAAQSPEREYVIGVGDQLDIQVFNQVQPLPNFSTRAQVRTDRMITMPWLGDIKVAGLKKSTLTTLLESQEYLGKFLTDPHVSITPAGMAATVTIVFSGVINVEQEVPRDAKFGQLLREITPSLQQYDPNFEAISIHSVEGEVFAPDPNVRLQWGDEIVIPALAPTPTPIPAEPTPLPRGAVPPLVQFTDEEYQAFQDFMQENYPEAYEQLLPHVRYEDDTTVIDLANLTAEQQAQLPQAVIDVLQQHLPKAEEPFDTGLALLGIRINLNVKGLQEAFLGFPEPEGGTLIRRFRKGDVIQPGVDGNEDLIMFDVDETAQRVIVEQGKSQQTITMTPPLSDISLVGIVANQRGKPEAILQGVSTAEIPEGPIQRKRYTEGDTVMPGLTLVKIARDQQVAVLQDEQQAVQVLFLHDPRKREASQPQAGPAESTSPLAEPDPFATPPPALPENDLQSMLKQQMPSQLQALDTFSQLFFATPLF